MGWANSMSLSATIGACYIPYPLPTTCWGTCKSGPVAGDARNTSHPPSSSTVCGSSGSCRACPSHCFSPRLPCKSHCRRYSPLSCLFAPVTSQSPCQSPPGQSPQSPSQSALNHSHKTTSCATPAGSTAGTGPGCGALWRCTWCGVQTRQHH